MCHYASLQRDCEIGQIHLISGFMIFRFQNVIAIKFSILVYLQRQRIHFVLQFFYFA